MLPHTGYVVGVVWTETRNSVTEQNQPVHVAGGVATTVSFFCARCVGEDGHNSRRRVDVALG